MNDIHLLFPPLVDPSYIPYRMSSLTRRLHLAGCNVQLSDNNQEAYQYFLEPDRLQRCLNHAHTSLREMETATDLTGIQAYRYYRTIRAIMYGSVLSPQLSTQWETFGQQNSAQQKKTRRSLQHALELASLPFFPTLIQLNDLIFTYSTQSTQDILDAIVDVQVNPYNNFWQPRIQYIQRNAPQCVVLWIEFDQQLIPAFTLAACLKATSIPPRIIATGPFISTFQEAWTSERVWSRIIDQFVCAKDPFFSLIESIPSEEHYQQKIWSLQGLPLEQYLCQPPTISLSLDEDGELPGEGEQTIEKSEHLFARMQVLAQEHPLIRFHISTPLNNILLLKLATLLQMHACSFTWGSTVAYGTTISTNTAQHLVQAHCRYLHLELKGYLGYSHENVLAQHELITSWNVIHQAGLHILWTVIYGHPLDDLGAFPDFIAFLTKNAEKVDKLVRFKVFRLYRHSRFWEHANDYHLSIEKEESQQRQDLQRFFNFRTQSGFDSRTFHTNSDQYIADLQKHVGELPNPPLLLDDWLFEEHLYGQENASASQPVFSEEDMIQVAPSTVVLTISYTYQQLDQQWRQFLYNLAELPHLTEKVPLTKNASTLMYTASLDRLLGANDGVRKIVSLCEQPVQGKILLNTFPDRQKPAVKKMLTKLIQDGFLKVVLHKL